MIPWVQVFIDLLANEPSTPTGRIRFHAISLLLDLFNHRYD